jgi:copper transport protein
VAAGTYAGRVVLPRTGTWAVSVSLRTSRFDNPVTEVDVQVR